MDVRRRPCSRTHTHIRCTRRRQEGRFPRHWLAHSPLRPFRKVGCAGAAVLVARGGDGRWRSTSAGTPSMTLTTSPSTRPSSSTRTTSFDLRSARRHRGRWGPLPVWTVRSWVARSHGGGTLRQQIRVVARSATGSNAATRPLAGSKLAAFTRCSRGEQGDSSSRIFTSGWVLPAVVVGLVHPTPPLIGVQPSWFATECSADVLYPLPRRGI